MEEEISISNRFYGLTLAPNQPLTLSMSSTELHITQATLLSDTGSASLVVSTNILKDIVLCRLSQNTPQVLLDINFFEGDESVTFLSKGDAPISIAGSTAIFGDFQVEDSDDEDEDEEEEKKAAPVAKKAAPAKAVKGAEKAISSKRQRDEEEESDDEIDVKSTLKAAVKAKAAPKVEEKPAPTKKEEKAKPVEKPAASPSPSNEMKTLSGGKVRYTDIIVGTGPKATYGSHVKVAYVGRLKNGKTFDQSSNFSFKIGTDDIIKGWNVGVNGMNVGGKRRLVIHPDYGYGARGSPPVIPPHSVLIFDIELLRV